MLLKNHGCQTVEVRILLGSIYLKGGVDLFGALVLGRRSGWNDREVLISNFQVGLK